MKSNKPEVQSLVLDAFATYKISTRVAEITGVSRTLLWRMAKMSEEGHPDFQNVDWGGEEKPYHEHLLDALDMAVEDIQQRVTRDAAEGYYVDEVQGGCYHFVEDEYAVSLTEAEFKNQLAMDDETREMCGFPRIWHDKMLREYDVRSRVWARVRVKKYIAPTVEAQAKVLAAFAPEVFGDKRRIDLNVSGGLGVSVIGTAMKPPQQVIDVTTVEAITDQSADEIEYNDTEYQPPEAPMVETPFTADPSSPLTPEQQRILQRARSANPLAQELAARAAAKMAEGNAPVAPKPIQPPPSTYRGDDMADDVPRSPRGMKVI
jgi:hypothetical protein